MVALVNALQAYFGSGMEVVSVNKNEFATVVTRSLALQFSKQSLDRQSVMVYGYAADQNVAAIELEEFIDKGNGLYAYFLVRYANTLQGFALTAERAQVIPAAIRKSMIMRMVAFDAFIRFTQGHSVNQLPLDGQDKLVITHGKVPAYLRNYLNLTFEQPFSAYKMLLGDAWIDKFPSDFLKSIDYSALPSDIAARLFLAPAGHRLIAAFAHLSQSDLRPGHHEDAPAFLDLMKSLNSKGFSWELHPLFRPAKFHSAIGNLNGKINTFLAEEINETKIGSLVTEKVLAVAPTAMNRHRNWMSLDESSFDFINPIDLSTSRGGSNVASSSSTNQQ